MSAQGRTCSSLSPGTRKTEVGLAVSSETHPSPEKVGTSQKSCAPSPPCHIRSATATRAPTGSPRCQFLSSFAHIRRSSRPHPRDTNSCREIGTSPDTPAPLVLARGTELGTRCSHLLVSAGTLESAAFPREIFAGTTRKSPAPDTRKSPFGF